MVDLHKYVKLDEIERVLKRPGMYIGSTSLTEQNTYYFDDDGKVQYGIVRFVPGFIKLFDEVLQNSYDHSKRPEGQHLNRIDVTLDKVTGEIAVHDNGGIPVEKHPIYDEYIPDFIFGEMGTGSNYDDTVAREGAGTNGLGAKLTNIYSKEFKVETADGRKRYKKTYKNNRSDESDVAITPSTYKYTKITWTPDYVRLGMDGLDEDHYRMLVRRVYEIAAASNTITVYLNDKKLDVKGFKSYIEKFTQTFLYLETGKWQLGFTRSDNGFQHVSFVNACSTWMGGPHVEHVIWQFIKPIQDYVLKKTKQELRPADIKAQFKVFINTTINNPAFSSQTKENLTTEPKDFGNDLVVEPNFIKKVLASPIVEDIIEWAVNRQRLQELQELKKANKEVKNANLKAIKKYETANEKTDRSKCVLFICEGDSAAGPLKAARDPKFQGVFPLKGKPVNVQDVKTSELANNEEITDLMKIIGLKFGEDQKISELRYGKLVIASDSDMDGYHIRGLVMSMFQTLWPGLIKQGFVEYLKTPIVRVEQGKKMLDFYTEEEYDTWQKKQTSKNYHSTYIKGLGGNDTKDFRKFMADDQYRVPIEWIDKSDYDAVNLAFDKSKADERKIWLYGGETSQQLIDG